MAELNTDTRWTIDRALLERLLGNEREFKERVLVDLTELKSDMRVLSESFKDHVKDDAEKFKTVNLSIGENSGKVGYIIAFAAGCAFLIGLGVAISRLFQ